VRIGTGSTLDGVSRTSAEMGPRQHLADHAGDLATAMAVAWAPAQELIAAAHV